MFSGAVLPIRKKILPRFLRFLFTFASICAIIYLERGERKRPNPKTRWEHKMAKAIVKTHEATYEMEFDAICKAIEWVRKFAFVADSVAVYVDGVFYYGC